MLPNNDSIDSPLIGGQPLVVWGAMNGIGATKAREMADRGEIATYRIGRRRMVAHQAALEYQRQKNREAEMATGYGNEDCAARDLIDKLLQRGHTIASIASAVQAARSTVRSWAEGKTEPPYSIGLTLVRLLERPAPRRHRETRTAATQ